MMMKEDCDAMIAVISTISHDAARSARECHSRTLTQVRYIYHIFDEGYHLHCC